MRKPLPASALEWLAAFLLTLGAFASPVPVIYSTDLFHPHQDPDDHFDLACLYALPEADVRAIILDQGDQQLLRPGFVAIRQLNHLTGRHVPAAIGLRDKLKSPEDLALDQPAEHQSGVNLILQSLREAREKAAIVFVGSARDVAAAYNREPALFHQKVRSIHGFIGEASDPTHQEWNVKLDPNAFVRLIRADVPFHWIPCFDGGAWTNHGHASFWRIRQTEVLGNAPAPLQRYFLYMLRHATNDPISCLNQPMDARDRDWMMGLPRNLWCGALLGLAVGRPLTRGGQPVVGFSPVELSIDDHAVVHYGEGPGSRPVMRFDVINRAAFAETATRGTALLLEHFPLARHP